MKIKSLFQSNFFVYFLSIFSTVVGFGLNFFLARILQAEAYGYIQYQLSLATTISSFLVFGLNSYIIREANNPEHKKDIMNKSFSLFFGVVIFELPIIFFILKNYLSLNAAFSLVVVFVSVFMGINTIVTALLQGKGKFQLSIIFESILPKIIMFAVVVIFIMCGEFIAYEQNYMVIYLLIYGVVALIFLFILFKKIDFSFVKRDLISILYFFGVTITYSLSTNLTKVLQGGLYDDGVALAIISVSLSMMTIIDVLTGIVTTICKPVFAKNHREGLYMNNIDIYRLNTRITSYIAIPIYIFLFTQPEKFLIIFGETYLQYPMILQILTIYSAVACLTGPNGTMLAMTGKEKWELINGGIYLVTFGLFAWLFSFDKIYGLCLALVLGQVFVNFAKYIEVWCFYKINPLNFKTFLSMIIIFIVDCLCIYFLKYISNFWIWLIVSIVVGAFLIVLNFILSLYKNTDFKDIRDLKI